MTAYIITFLKSSCCYHFRYRACHVFDQMSFATTCYGETAATVFPAFLLARLETIPRATKNPRNHIIPAAGQISFVPKFAKFETANIPSPNTIRGHPIALITWKTSVLLMFCLYVSVSSFLDILSLLSK